MKRTIVNPHWTNNARTVLAAQFHYDDGRIVNAVISETETSNPDFAEILSKFTKEEIEKNTIRRIQKLNSEKLTADQKKQEEIERVRLEKLFAAKLEIFEVPGIKNSTDRNLKSQIRKSGSVIEAQAWASALLIKEFTASTAAAANTSTDTTASE